jgi:hypothetical protein
MASEEKVTWTVERFNDPKYSRPRYRVRSDKRVNWQINGFTHASMKFKRDAIRYADSLNKGN